MRLCLLVIVALVASACQKNSDASKSASSLKPRYFFDAITGDDDYADIFDRNTVSDRTHSDFLPVMTAFATIWNSNLREAYIREMAGRYRYDAAAEKQLATEELQENESFIVIILSAATREPEWNDLERQKSIWRITLESADGKIQDVPERIEVISQKDERAKYFYQRMDSFTRTFRLRFQREKFRNASNLVLHLSGVRGNLEFPFTQDGVTPGVSAR